MTSAAHVEDPYCLPLPVPQSPAVLPHRISPGNQHANSRYQEMIWSLGPLIDNPGTSVRMIHWKICPEPLRSQLKLPTWTMINGELRPTHLVNRGGRSAGRSSAGEMRLTCQEWMRLARWLIKRGVTDLGACTEREWLAYITDRWAEGVRRDYAEKILGRLTDLWAFDGLSARPAGIPRPPWEAQGVDDYLPNTKSTTDSGENATEPLAPQVIGPLLTWALRMVDDFADDILAAWAEHQRLGSAFAAACATPESAARLRDLLIPLIRSGQPLPCSNYTGSPRLALTFIAATTGATRSQVQSFARGNGLIALAAEQPGPCRLDVPIQGRVDGKPWREYIDYTEAPSLMRHLGTAAAIVILYLTGMRPQEVQALRSGCCPDPDPADDGSIGPHLIVSNHFKNVTDEDGHHISAGEERQVPWVAIPPVAKAIRVLERIVPEGELLFSAAHHDFAYRRGLQGALKRAGLNHRIEDFVVWANGEAHSHGFFDQIIPEDPHGPIGLTRFRRTLAWHIARRPGGLIALAIQYGHMRTVLDARTSSGYASRSRSGLHGILDVETALAAADTAAQLRDRAAAGERISGPAARRAITAAAHTPHFEGRTVPAKFARKAAAFLARDGIVLHDNPDAFLICAFKRDTALCDPDPGSNTPNQPNCRPGCSNTVRTDTHAHLLRKRADEIDNLAAHTPHPVGNRLRINADRLRQYADAHDATAQTAETLT